MSFASQFKAGSDIAGDLINTYQTAKRRKEFADLAQQQPVDAFTVEQGDQLNATANATKEDGTPYYTVTPGADGKTYSVQPNFQNETGATPTDYSPSTVAPRGASFLGKNYDAPLTESQTTGARQQAMAGILDQSDPEAAMKYRQMAQQGTATDLLIAQARKKGVRDDQADADNAALRKALMGGIPTAPASMPASQPTQGVQDQLAAGAGMGDARTMASTGVTGVVGAGQPLTPNNIQTQQNDLQGYLTNAAPEVMKTLLSQGKLKEAKAYSDFIGTETGKNYATSWVTGLRKHAMGDHAGAIKSFEHLYNSQMYNDGQTVKIDPIGDGAQYRVQMFGADGKNIGSQTLDPATLARQAALMLNPTEAVKFHAEQQGKRDAEAATLDRQVQLEGLKQETAGMHEDRRDARLATQLDARANRPAGRLTQTQERSNFEIDAAREAVANLSPAEIRRRTAKQTDTGRENGDYDPTLARAANLAGRRKVGDDQTFDNRRGGSTQQAPAVDRQEVAKRFRSDTKMSAFRLGNQTPRGTEVLDKAGKVIGHYK